MFHAIPITACCVARGIASLVSTAGLFLLLCSMRGVGMQGAFAAALLWNLNEINMPFMQDQAEPVFTFGLACLIIAARLGFPNRWTKILYVPAAFLAGSVRPEYHLLWILYIPFQLCRTRWRQFTKMECGLFAGLMTVFAAGAILAHHWIAQRVHAEIGFFDHYLYLGLAQCYAALYVTTHPAAGFDPMVEFPSLISRVFHSQRGFAEAVRNNPLEVLRYLAANSYSNLKALPGLFREHSVFLPGAYERVQGGGIAPLLALERWLLLAWLGLGNLWLAWKFARKGLQTGFRVWLDERVYFLLSLAAVSFIAFVLLIPSPRYWVSMVPLVYCGSAICGSRLAARLSGTTQAALGALLFLACSHPVLLDAPPDDYKQVILALRSEVRRLVKEGGAARPGGKFTIFGFYVEPLAAMANPERLLPSSIATLGGNSSFSEQVLTSAPDFVVMDDELRSGRQYAMQKDFFASFIGQPAPYGYKEIIRGTGWLHWLIYEKIQPASRAEPAALRSQAPAINKT